MKKIFLLIAILAVALSSCVYADDEFAAAVKLYDEDYLMFVAGYGEGLYMLRDSGIYLLDCNMEEKQVVPKEKTPEEIDYIFCDGKALYSLSAREKLCITQITDNEGKTDIKILFNSDEYQYAYFQNPIVKDGKLYALNNNMFVGNIFIIDLKSGKKDVLEPGFDNVRAFDFADKDTIVMLAGKSTAEGYKTTLELYNLNTKKAEPYCKNTGNINASAIKYNPYNKTMYMLGRSEIYSVKQGEEPILSDRFISGDVYSVTRVKGALAFIVDGMLVIRPFNPAKGPSVTIADSYGRGEDYKQFISAHPETDLKFKSLADKDVSEQFIQDMITRNDEADIYAIDDTNLLGAIKNKGYFYDLAQDEYIKDRCKHMYEPFKKAFMQGKEVAAMPKEIYFECMYYDKDIIKQFGFTLPKTYEEYLDFCLNWYEKYQDDNPDILLYQNLSAESILLKYTDEIARNGGDIKYSSPYLKNLMDKYFKLLKKSEEFSYTNFDSKYIFYSYDFMVLNKESKHGFMPLVFIDGNTPTVGPDGNLSYFVINPYSKNKQAALELLRLFDKNSTAQYRAMLFNDMAEPVINADYKEQKERYEEKIKELEELFKSSEEKSKPIVEEQITQYKDYLSENEKYKWAITKDAIDNYKTFVNYIYINPYNPLEDLIKGDPRLLDNAANNDMLLQELDRKTQLVLLENK